MRAVLGAAAAVVGLFMCAFDLSQRVGRQRRNGGLIRAVWAPDDTPVLFYTGLALTLVASLLLFGTASP